MNDQSSERIRKTGLGRRTRRPLPLGQGMRRATVESVEQANFVEAGAAHPMKRRAKWSVGPLAGNGSRWWT
jgi:hypothetical protein